MKNDLFRVSINLIVFATDIPRNKRYILSVDEKKIKFPRIFLDQKSVSCINSSLIKFLKDNYIFVSDFELIPQIITPHSINIPDNDNMPTINMVYGFIINYTTNINNSYWIEYDFIESTEYSDVIIETIQKLR